VGTEAVSVIVYAPLATPESVEPARYAIARIVVVADTAIGAEYTVPVVEVGVEPSVVYRMVAPEVDVDSVTLCALAYVPAAGLNVGAETVVVVEPNWQVSSPPHPQSRIAATSRTRIAGTLRFIEIPPSFSIV
jgi:hypothetical protein